MSEREETRRKFCKRTGAAAVIGSVSLDEYSESDSDTQNYRDEVVVSIKGDDNNGNYIPDKKDSDFGLDKEHIENNVEGELDEYTKRYIEKENEYIQDAIEAGSLTKATGEDIRRLQALHRMGVDAEEAGGFFDNDLEDDPAAELTESSRKYADQAISAAFEEQGEFSGSKDTRRQEYDSLSADVEMMMEAGRSLQDGTLEEYSDIGLEDLLPYIDTAENFSGTMEQLHGLGTRPVNPDGTRAEQDVNKVVYEHGDSEISGSWNTEIATKLFGIAGKEYDSRPHKRASRPFEEDERRLVEPELDLISDTRMMGTLMHSLVATNRMGDNEVRTTGEGIKVGDGKYEEEAGHLWVKDNKWPEAGPVIGPISGSDPDLDGVPTWKIEDDKIIIQDSNPLGSWEDNGSTTSSNSGGKDNDPTQTPSPTPTRKGGKDGDNGGKGGREGGDDV